MEAKKIAAMAEAASVGVRRTTRWDRSLVSLRCILPSRPPTMSFRRRWWRRPLVLRRGARPIRMVDGHWQIPELPGLGIEVNEAECVRYPFQQEVIHTVNAVLGDGTIVDW